MCELDASLFVLKKGRPTHAFLPMISLFWISYKRTFQNNCSAFFTPYITSSPPSISSSMNIHYMSSPSRQHPRRKRRVYHPPPQFWDKLTKLWLTKSALRENNRRILSLSSSRTFFTKSYTFAPDFLRSCPATCLQEIRRLSRCGGPDLSDLRHVSCSSARYTFIPIPKVGIY